MKPPQAPPKEGMCLRGLVRICVTESLQRSPPSPSRGLGGFHFIYHWLFQSICNKDIPSRGLGGFHVTYHWLFQTICNKDIPSFGGAWGGLHFTYHWLFQTICNKDIPSFGGAWGGYSFYLFSASIAFIFCFTSFISSLSFSIRRFISSMRLLPFLELILKKPRLFS